MVKEWFADLAKLLFPNNCFCCKQDLVSEEEHICSSCITDLPQTNFHEHKENALSQKLKGRFIFEQAVAVFYFNVEGKMQEILHEIKYRNNEHLALYLGKLMATKMKGHFSKVDIIIPVPLHASRISERGYNQSELLAKGLNEVWNIPFSSNAVKRIKNTQSQTHKTRSERTENMKNAFDWKKEMGDKHILLVDDVITTGSTIESLVMAMPSSFNGKISILSLATAVES